LTWRLASPVQGPICRQRVRPSQHLW